MSVDHWWNEPERKECKYSDRKTCPCATLSTINPTQPGLQSIPGLHNDTPARDPVSHFSTIRSYGFNSSGIFFCLGTLYHNTLFSSYSGHQTMLERRKNCPYTLCGSPCVLVPENHFEQCHFKVFQNNVTAVSAKILSALIHGKAETLKYSIWLLKMSILAYG